MRTGDSVGAFYVFPYISGKTEPTSDIIRIFVTLNIIRMKTKKKDSFMDYIKANRKGSREAEIENHGHPVSFNRVHVSKKVYNRKRDKADASGILPYLYIVVCRQLVHVVVYGYFSLNHSTIFRL